MKAIKEIPSQISNLQSTLLLASDRKFTGKLKLNLLQQQQFDLYFNLGRLTWANGGNHPNRRGYRLLSPYYQMICSKGLQLSSADIHQCQDYYLLTILVKEQKLHLEQIIKLIRLNLTEVLFDIYQVLNRIDQNQNNYYAIEEVFQLQWKPSVRPCKQGILPPWCMLEAEAILNYTQQSWENWSRAGLSSYSPNLAPILQYKSLLEKQTSPVVYQNLVKLINGKRTLRDIAHLMKQDATKVTKSLLPYIRQKLIILNKIPDFSTPITGRIHQQTQPPKKTKPVRNKPPLVICIDDNFQTCKIMEAMLKADSYRCITIQDAVQALPTLLKHKPDVIFLDLVMPIANGYEICAQIRRISIFQDIPIIILTGSDGIVDRVRAKMVGATDFLPKPIDPQRVKSKLRKYAH